MVKLSCIDGPRVFTFRVAIILIFFVIRMTLSYNVMEATAAAGTEVTPLPRVTSVAQECRTGQVEGCLRLAPDPSASTEGWAQGAAEGTATPKSRAPLSAGTGTIETLMWRPQPLAAAASMAATTTPPEGQATTEEEVGLLRTSV